MPVIFSSDYIDEIDRLKTIYYRYEFGLVTEAGEAQQAQQAPTGILGSLMNVIKEIFNIIRGALSGIGGMLANLCMSPEKRAQYNEFEKWVAQNPQVKTQQINVKDWNKINAEYDNAQKQLEAAYNNPQIDSKALNTQANGLFANLGSVLNSATTAVTVDAAMYFAKSSPNIAKGVQVFLLNNEQLLKNLEAEIGQKATDKMLNDVNRLTKETAYRKIMGRLGLMKQKTLAETVDGYVNSMLSVKNIGKNPIKAAKFAMDHKAGAKVLAKSYKNNSNVRQGVKQIRAAANDAKGMINAGKNIAKDPMNAAFNMGMNALNSFGIRT